MRLLALILVLTSSAAGQRRGDVSPAWKWDKLKGDCPAKLNPSDLNGKVVVLSVGDDFPDPGSVIDWNDLPKRFPNDPVVFLKAVAGPEYLIDQALKSATYQGCILLDRTEANRGIFRLSTATATVVIDQRGQIAGYSHEDGGDAIERSIRAVLDARVDTGLSESLPERNPPHTTPADNVSWDVVTKKSKPNAPHGFEDGQDRYVANNLPLDFIVSTLWDTPRALIVLPDSTKTQRYTVRAHIPVSDYELLKKLCRESVEKQLGVSVVKEMRNTRVYVMSASNQPSTHLQAAGDDETRMTGGSDNSFIGTNQTTREIANALQDLLRTPVIDEADMKGKYDYSATSNLTGSEAALDFARQLGFDFKPEDRLVEMLVVSPGY